MAEEQLLLYVVPVIVVLATCLLLYLCSVQTGHGKQPDFAILSRSSKQQQAASAADDDGHGVDGRKGLLRSSTAVAGGGGASGGKQFGNKLNSAAVHNQQQSRNNKRVPDQTPTGVISAKQRKADLHESHRRDRAAVSISDATNNNLLNSVDALTDRSSGIGSTTSECIGDENIPPGNNLQLTDLVPTVPEVSPYVLENGSIGSAALRSTQRWSDDDATTAVVSSEAVETSSSPVTSKTTSFHTNADNNSHQRQRKLAPARHTHAYTAPIQQRVKRFDTDAQRTYSPQTTFYSNRSLANNNNSSSNAAYENDNLTTSNGGWKVMKPGEELVFVNSKAKQQMRDMSNNIGNKHSNNISVTTTVPSTTARRGPTPKQNSASPRDELANNNHHYCNSDTSSIASLPINGNRSSNTTTTTRSQQQQQQHATTLSSPRQSSGGTTGSAKTAYQSTAPNKQQNGAGGDLKNANLVNGAREQHNSSSLAPYQQKSSSTRHETLHNSTNHHHIISTDEQQVQTDELLADWLPVILDVLLCADAYNNNITDDNNNTVLGAAAVNTKNIDGMDSVHRHLCGGAVEPSEHMMKAESSSCQTVGGYAAAEPQHAHVDPAALSDLVVAINSQDDEGFYGEGCEQPTLPPPTQQHLLLASADGNAR